MNTSQVSLNYFIGIIIINNMPKSIIKSIDSLFPQFLLNYVMIFSKTDRAEE